jgi:hypothetical protein
MPDILADYREWRDQQAARVSTHSDRCHMWHRDCMIHRLAAALERAISGAGKSAPAANTPPEPSPVCAGSHVALHRVVRALLDGVNARYAKNPREWTCPHMQTLDDMTQSEPQPTLTDEEREAVEYYIGTGGPDAVDATLRTLLERTK